VGAACASARKAALAKLRAAIETPRTGHVWGQEREITPAFVDATKYVSWAGETRLILVQPLATRPNYYVLLAPATWKLDEDEVIEDGVEEDDWLDTALDAIVEEHGDHDRCDCEVEDERVRPEKHDEECSLRRGFPALGLSCGYSWGDHAWPEALAAEDLAALKAAPELAVRDD